MRDESGLDVPERRLSREVGTTKMEGPPRVDADVQDVLDGRVVGDSNSGGDSAVSRPTLAWGEVVEVVDNPDPDGG